MEKHIESNSNGKFECDECQTELESKSDLWEHFCQTHKNQKKNADGAQVKVVHSRPADDEVLRLQKELKSLKNNFERLESLFKDKQEEAEKNRCEYERT